MAGYEGMDGAFASQLQAMVAASGGRISITSGYRSPERQAQLWEAALRKYGDPEVADNWVARPGKSNHGNGIAADLGFSDQAAREWAHANAGKFGLHFPMSWEPWHIEPLGSTLRSDRGAYTTAPTGFVNPRDQLEGGLDPTLQAEDPYDPGVQARRLVEIFHAGPDAEALFGSPTLGMEAPSMEAATIEPEAQAAAITEGVA